MPAERVGIAGVILAGGRSRRMGADKAFIEIAGRPMLAHVITRLAPQVAPLALNANGDAARFAAFGLPVIADPAGGFAGPLTGILAALRWAIAEGVDLVITTPVDAPFLPADLVARLHDELGAGEAAVARSRGRRHPVFGLWRVGLAAPLAHWLATGAKPRVLSWLETLRVADVDFPDGAGGDPFFNVNTPTDAVEAALREGQPCP